MWKLTKIMLAAQPRATALLMILSIVAGASMSAVIGLIGSEMSTEDRGMRDPLIALLFASVVFQFLARATGNYLAQTLKRNLQLEMAENAAAVELIEVERLGPAKLIAGLMDDSAKLAAGMMSVPILMTSILIVVGVTAHLAWVSLPGVGLWALQLALGGVFVVIANRLARALYEKSRAALDDLLTGFRGVAEGAKELRIGWKRREGFLSRFVRVPTLKAAQAHIRGETVHDVALMFGQTFSFGSVVVALYAGAVFGMGNSEVLTYVITLLYISGPVTEIVIQMPFIQTALVAKERVDAVRALRDMTGKGSMLAPTDEQANIELLEVWYKYPPVGTDEGFEVGPIDIQLAPGTITFFVGGNGSGKSTLAKIVAGLYMPSEGDVRLNGRTMADDDMPLYREHVAAVFADYYLFDRAWGGGAEGDALANELLRELELPKSVVMQDGVFSTIALSSGQQRRLALVLAMLDERPFYIFDEWAADQDVRYKEVFYRRLLPELRKKGKTVLVVSHDDRYFPIADQLIKLDGGKQVTEQTTQFMVRLRGSRPE